ncbi:MAG: hypothetical protein ACFFAH_08590, partial [Promethearchaeota archaeon]
RYRNEGESWGTWEPASGTKSWTLTSGDGTKTVYYEIIDNAGFSSIFSDIIDLDTTDPTGSITIDAGADWTTSTDVELTLTFYDATSGVDQVRYRNEGESWGTWEPASGTKSWTLTSGDGIKTVYYEIIDNAGLSSIFSDTIGLDTGSPYVLFVSSTANNGTYYIGDTIVITITFSEDVIVLGSGTLQLCLETGDIDAIVNYAGGSGENILRFSYKVELGHNSSDLDYNSTDALLINGIFIQDLAGNDADSTLPTPGEINSLSYNKDIVIYGFYEKPFIPSDDDDDGNGNSEVDREDISELYLIGVILVISAAAVASTIAVLLIKKR